MVACRCGPASIVESGILQWPSYGRWRQARDTNEIVSGGHEDKRPAAPPAVVVETLLGSGVDDTTMSSPSGWNLAALFINADFAL
jgi:hypothetical protein